MKQSLAVLSLVAALGVAAGCARTAQTVSFRFVQPTALPSAAANDKRYEVTRGETVFVDARPIQPLATPNFPNGMPLPRGDAVTVVVRILVGADGRVEDVRKSLGDFSLPGAFSAECLAAVQAAVAQWRFEPAQLAVVHPQPDGRPLIISSTPTERTFEVAFLFSSSGRVVSEFSQTGKPAAK